MNDTSLTINQNDLNSIKKPRVLKRSWVVFFCFSGCFIMFLLRYNMSVAIVAIRDDKVQIDCPSHVRYLISNSSMNDLTTFQPNIVIDDESDSVICYKKRYDLDEVMVSQLLAAYFYGYSAFQLPVGRLSEKYGGKQLVGYAVLLSGILTAITPLTLDLSPIFTIIIRFLIGTLHAGILSSAYTLFSRWLPKEKNANAITWSNIGYELGGMISFFLTGYISNLEYLGWRYSFYLFSITSFIWFIPYHYLVYSTPDDDPNLSEYEKKLIEQEKKIEYKEKDLENKKVVEVAPKLDMKVLLTSGPVWASLVAKFAYGFGYYVITTKIPDYLKEVFNLPIDQNGIYSAAPLLGILLSKILCLKLSSLLINMNVMSLTNVRKFFQSISLFTPTICLFILTFKNDDKNLDIFLITMAMFGAGMVCAGDSPITAEFSGPLSGSVFGLTNTLACANGFLAPIFVGLALGFISDKYLAWNFVFYTAIVIYFIGGAVFSIWASAELQEWAKPKLVVKDKEMELNRCESSA